ncbi:hypothetical protein PFICI_14601 [Pestalotiopsis fici W106-1]|uniref:NAD(P)-binding domain-containing protein n=1 Tax=Pestalotiopsis fici (strain W106-1 / CGMCC3.15140) TaxID=1229662 RepID=W3WIA1_PESFW|nr:uncharacterized protein PFICI_14601 [Pestalotiopsis fici W106-1]ETS73655.1 hypothetical protein PFICI_14601 [Pestalotiopsis fici W106-1]
MAEDIKDPRVNIIIHKDFENYDAELLDKLKGARGCVWALGISQTQVGPEEYVKITKDFTLAAAKAFGTLGTAEEPFHFVFVSGNGATTEPGRLTPIFGRVKGQTEVALAELRKANPALHALSTRPAFVDGHAHTAIHPYLPTRPFTLRLIDPILGPPIRWGLKSFHSPTEPLGRVLTELALGKHQSQFVPAKDLQMIDQFPILENSVLRRLAGI